MTIGIISYKRANEPITVNLLRSMGYDKEEIVVSVQTESDYEEYLKTQGNDATVIYKKGNNVSENRNNLLDYLKNERAFVMCDDDISGFYRLSANGKTLEQISDKTELERLFHSMFRFAVKNNSKVFGWYTVSNPFFMKHTIDNKNILNGQILGVVCDKTIRFDENFSVKEDYELSLRLMKRGMNVIRYNGFTVKAKSYSKGGCEEFRKAGKNKGRYLELLKKYPMLIKPSHRDGEIKFIGKIEHIKESEIWKK